MVWLIKNNVESSSDNRSVAIIILVIYKCGTVNFFLELNMQNLIIPLNSYNNYIHTRKQ